MSRWSLDQVSRDVKEKLQNWDCFNKRSHNWYPVLAVIFILFVLKRKKCFIINTNNSNPCSFILYAYILFFYITIFEETVSKDSCSW